MRKIYVAEDQKFVVSNQDIEKIIVNLRNVAAQYGSTWSPEVQNLVKALWTNVNYMKVHTGPKKSNWLINMLSNGEAIMKVITRDERFIFYDIFTTIQQMAGENLASEAIGPHQQYWTSGMSEYAVLETDTFAKYYSRFTISYAQTYSTDGDISIALFADLNTGIYRMGFCKYDGKLSNWTHLNGGFNGFTAIKYYLSEMMREDFSRVNADAYKQACGYVPSTNEIRKLPYAPSCTLITVRHLNKPTFLLKANRPNISQWTKATY